MSTRDELEAALVVGLDRHTLAVYADYLQSIADPRGELIALDLELEGRACPPELASRRTALLHAWLGALVPGDNVHRSWVGDSLRFGFIDDVQLDDDDPNALARLDALLASDAGRYIRGVTLRGRAPDLDANLQRLAATHHVWLRRLTLDCRLIDGSIADATMASLVTAMPNLELLEVSGHNVFAACAHPSLRRLVITGSHAINSAADSEPFATVTDLDVKFGVPHVDYYMDEAEPEPELEAVRVLVARLPALRKLDLSRNDPSATPGRYYDYEDQLYENPEAPPLSAIAHLAHLPGRDQLTHVRLPSIRSEDEARELDAALRTMPALVELEIVHGHYFEIPDLAHPTAKLVRPPPWPWPRPASLDHAAAISIAAPGMRSGEPVALVDAIRVLEQRFESLPAAARDAWTQFWRVLDDPDADRTFPVATLLRALEACPIETGGWRQLDEELRSRRPFAPDAVVRLTS